MVKMDNKAILTVIAIVIAVLLLTSAAGYNRIYNEMKSANAMTEDIFVAVAYGDNYYIVYDKETKVMYTKSNSSSNCGDFTLLVNADGTPKLWESEVQR